ncbi:septal ring lytic transglycosylase RlpA family protein [Acidipila rosea]|uniref:Probable endolytic peptidoglycan transglycosylase RlpA n=1 Tax=Acidipila rosea TaxID=768535 RepID=A0A4R1LFX4_9BACT|nr:septal ring lytic transglycosylase RlpA family protein [Acidipila rosea]MBW4025864.1 septal ring lytic transglycosylase RlpA family protein [Acidobacteriota bacterium]MBW4044217.1 septal ring lytic transglycosylase RlpA family protein [Acidobacteriota bacterium]TCK75753.1 rare lipoprotein A [Acidipila rosea]
MSYRHRIKRFSTYASLMAAAAVLFTANETSRLVLKPAAQNTQTAAAQQPTHHWYQVGRASWYGKFFQGQPTASGESYDFHQLTCAHRTLPLGSLVRVTNLRNHKSVVVRVNDRGPVPETRVVDLSFAAAHFLGFTGRGTAKVKLELLQSGPEVAHLQYPQTSPQTGQ